MRQTTNPATKPTAPGGYANVNGCLGTYEDLFKVCEFTPEQAQKIKEIEARKAKTTADAQAAMKPAQDEMNKAQGSGDQGALYKAIAKYNAAGRPLYDAMLKGGRLSSPPCSPTSRPPSGRSTPS